MSAFSKILVGLDLTDTDKIVIGFVSNFAKSNPGIEHIYFVHVERDLELPDEIREKYGQELLPTDEALKKQMQEEVEQFPFDKNIAVSYELLEGEPLKQLLHWSKVKLVDLVIAGKKGKDKGTGIVMEKLARKSSCSILFVTEKYSGELKRILIPLDFSKKTEFVIEKAKEMIKSIPEAKFVFLNVVDVPVGYYKIGKTFEEFAEIMKDNARGRWENYKATHSLEDWECEFVVNNKENIAKVIFDYARGNSFNMIMMASKGQTDASVFLLGSVAEKVVSYDYDIPLLLVKKPGEVLDFFDAMDRM